MGVKRTEKSSARNEKSMTRTQAIFMLMVLCGQLGLSFSVASRPRETPIVAAPSRFAYRLEVIPDVAFHASMDALGAQGWQLVSARRANNAAPGAAMEMAYEAIFAREIR